MAHEEFTRFCKNELQKWCAIRGRLTLKEIATVIDDYETSVDSGIADYAESKKTRLYNENGGAYCELLQLLEINKDRLDVPVRFMPLYG